jgi:cyclohexanone monooxygenase
MPEKPERFDAVVVGAGFAGLYMLLRLRELGMRVVVFEAGDGVGGTWYWNRYPGARCDAESMGYSYSFSPELEQEWEWTERYATQPEILRYADHVAERFDLKRDIRFETRVVEAHYREADNVWAVATDRGDQVEARFCIMATGCLSVPQRPDIPGLDDFEGPTYVTGEWPHEGVDFTGLRVGLVGTGSSAIQAVPVIADQAEHLTVFQRTANFSVPAENGPLDPDWVREFKEHYRDYREDSRHGLVSDFGALVLPDAERKRAVGSTRSVSAAERDARYEELWQVGGAYFMAAFEDTMLDSEANAAAAEFVRAKIREIVEDPETAEHLCPTSHPIGTKRICVDTGYYEAYNRPNVTLVDIAGTPIETVTAKGLRVRNVEYEFDVLVLATGFDAMTGALLGMDIRGVGGERLAEHWQAGPRSYLGLCVAGFPNLVTITGPGSPSVLSNMMVSIEQHVEWVTDCLRHMAEQGLTRLEAQRQAEDDWVEHVNEVANATLYPEGGSWYLGANIPGKPRVFMPYAGGVGAYREICDRVTARGYEGFSIT